MKEQGKRGKRERGIPKREVPADWGWSLLGDRGKGSSRGEIDEGRNRWSPYITPPSRRGVSTCWFVLASPGAYSVG